MSILTCALNYIGHNILDQLQLLNGFQGQMVFKSRHEHDQTQFYKFFVMVVKQMQQLLNPYVTMDAFLLETS